MRFPVLLAIAAAAASSAAPAQYDIAREGSYLLAVTGKAGLFGFAGHDHAIAASQWTAQPAFDPRQPANSSATVVIPVSGLVIDSPEARRLAQLGPGPSLDDVKTIHARMLGPEVLDAARYPAIVMKAVSVQPGGPDLLQLTGDLTLHGQTRRITVPVHYSRDPAGAYTFDGEFKIRQTDFGMKPESAGAGTVKVKDEMQIRFRVLLVPAR